jgi:outer membrane protein assembly factor BamB
VRWRAELPEPGNSTPVVWGDSVLVTQARKSEGQRLLLCYDRASGKLRWQTAVVQGDHFYWVDNGGIAHARGPVVYRGDAVAAPRGNARSA